VVACTGELGAGKTCFLQGLARGLGVTTDVTSPTFVLINQYRGRLPVYHLDAYRTGSLTELVDLGLEEMLHGDGVAVVEWARQAAAVPARAHDPRAPERPRRRAARDRRRRAGGRAGRSAADPRRVLRYCSPPESHPRPGAALDMTGDRAFHGAREPSYRFRVAKDRTRIRVGLAGRHDHLHPQLLHDLPHVSRQIQLMLGQERLNRFQLGR
jgi:hypothetical protein